MKLSSAILVSALLVVAMPTSAHDVSGYPGNPIEAWDCGETRVELNKHATRSFDLYSLKGSPSSGLRAISLQVSWLLRARWCQAQRLALPEN